MAASRKLYRSTAQGLGEAWAEELALTDVAYVGEHNRTARANVNDSFTVVIRQLGEVFLDDNERFDHDVFADAVFEAFTSKLVELSVFHLELTLLRLRCNRRVEPVTA